MATYPIDIVWVNYYDLELGGHDIDLIWFSDVFGTQIDEISIGIYDAQLGDSSEELLNPSFEIPLTAGDADYISVPASWEETSYAGGYASAEFGPPLRWTEAYEAEWSDNHLALSGFIDSDFSQYVFGLQYFMGGGDLFPLLAESYEREWYGNENNLQEFATTNLSSFTWNDDEDETDDFERQRYKRHEVNDTQHITDSSLPSFGDPAGMYARLNEMKAKYEVHRLDTTVHTAADTAHAITAPDCGDGTSALALVNDLWVQCWGHMVDAGTSYHLQNNGAPVLEPEEAAYPADDSPAKGELLAALLIVYLNGHFTWLDQAGVLGYDEFSDTLVAGDDLYSYLYPYSFVGGSAETYEEDWNGNQDNLTELAPGDVSGFDFTIYTGTTDAETYDDAQAVIAVPAVGSDSSHVDVSPTGEVRALASGTGFVGEVDIETRRGSSSTFVARATIDALPAWADLLSGTTSVRLHTLAHSAGSLSVWIYWKPISTM